MKGTPTWGVDTTTEILTDNGWCRSAELTEDAEVYALDPHTGFAHWERMQDHAVWSVRAHNVIRMEGRGHSSVTNMGQGWPVRHRGSSTWGRRWKMSSTLNQVDYIQCAAPAADLPTRAKWSNAFVEICAWLWTEGHWSGSRALSLCQSSTVNPTKCARIRAALLTLYGPPCTNMYPYRFLGKPLWTEDAPVASGVITWRINQAGSRPFIPVLSQPEKIIPTWWLRELTQEQLDLFIEASLAADGHAAKGRLAQKSPARAEAFALACLLAGHSVSFCPITNKHHPGVLEIGVLRRTQVAPLQQAANRDGRPFQVETFKYTGELWCPRTPTGTWLARRQGSVYWTGGVPQEE